MFATLRMDRLGYSQKHYYSELMTNFVQKHSRNIRVLVFFRHALCLHFDPISMNIRELFFVFFFFVDLQLKDLASPWSTTVMAAFFVAATTESGNHSQASLQLPNGRLEFPWLSGCHSWCHKEVSVPKGKRRNNKLVEVSNFPSFATSIQGLA